MQLASNEVDQLHKEKRTLEDEILKLKEDIEIDKILVSTYMYMYTTFVSRHANFSNSLELAI